MRVPSAEARHHEPPGLAVRAGRRASSKLRSAVSAVGSFGLLGALLLSTPISGETSSAFTFNWMGTPASPLSTVAAGWDTQIHKRAPGDSMEPMLAQHGTDCSAPPSMHPISQLADGVFICKNHLMTAIGDSGYGEIALTPDHMVDFSQGTATIKVSVSTLQFNTSDFIEIWVTPFNENVTLPFEFDVDLQGPPRDALRFSMNSAGSIGTKEGDVRLFSAGSGSTVPKSTCTWQYPTGHGDGTCLADVLAASGTVRTTYEIDLSQNHVRFGLPGTNSWWTDANVSVPFTQGIVQIVHHSYNPLKHDPGTGIYTWHWSDFSISNAVPFTIVNGAERSVNAGGATTVHFPAASPSGSFLRFSGIGTLQVSYNGGASWVNAV
jgi:hypothetical protein